MTQWNDLKTYAVDGIADIWDTFKEPDGSMVRYCIRTHSAFFRSNTAITLECFVSLSFSM